MNFALEAAVVALVVITTVLGTCLSLRALPPDMPGDVRRVARWCGAALGSGLGSVLVVGLLVQASGLDVPRTIAVEAILGAALAAMVAEHAAAARRLHAHWAPATDAPPPPAPVTLPDWLPSLSAPAAFGAASAVCAALLLAATALDPALPHWTVLFGVAAACQAMGIAVVAGRHRLAVR